MKNRSFRQALMLRGSAGSPRRAVALAVPALALSLLGGCATTRTLATRAAAPPLPRIGPGTTVFVLAPKVSVESADPNSPASSSKIDRDALARHLTGAATAALHAHGAAVRTIDGPAGNPRHDVHIASALTHHADQFFRAFRPPKILAELRQLAGPDDRRRVLVQWADVIVSPKGNWDFFSGAITASMDSVRLHAAILDPATGNVLWKNEVLFRDLPTARGARFASALKALFPASPNQPNDQ